jgi:death-on-curing family protein
LTATLSESRSILDLIKTFAQTWVSLDVYDKSAFPDTGITKQEIDVNADMIARDIQSLRHQLIEHKLASDLFAVERNPHSVESIFANIFQSFDGRDIYPTIEEKAAHLLYFMVKNHPFIDGNKRSGAFSFVWFLNKVTS